MPPDTVTPITRMAAGQPGDGFESLLRIFDRLRSDIEFRRRQQLARVANAEEILTKLVASVDRSMVDVVVTVGRKKKLLRKSVSDLDVVERAVATFGEETFLLAELVARVALVSPRHCIEREAISRRLHDLKRKGIVVATRIDSASDHTHTRSYFAYRRRLAGPTPRDSRPPVP